MLTEKSGWPGLLDSSALDQARSGLIADRHTRGEVATSGGQTELSRGTLVVVRACGAALTEPVREAGCTTRLYTGGSAESPFGIGTARFIGAANTASLANLVRIAELAQWADSACAPAAIVPALLAFALRRATAEAILQARLVRGATDFGATIAAVENLAAALPRHGVADIAIAGVGYATVIAECAVGEVFAKMVCRTRFGKAIAIGAFAHGAAFGFWRQTAVIRAAGRSFGAALAADGTEFLRRWTTELLAVAGAIAASVVAALRQAIGTAVGTAFGVSARADAGRTIPRLDTGACGNGGRFGPTSGVGL